MVDYSNIYAKFARNYDNNPRYRMMPYESALAQMVQDGVLTKAEYDQLIKTSAFGFGFGTGSADSVDFGGTTPLEMYQHSPSGGIVTSKDKPKFGQLDSGYIDIATLPVNYQIIPGEYTILTGDAYTAFSYLSDIFNEAETSFEQQRMNEGWVSDAINAWREWVNAKATRSDVSEKLADTRNDIELLNAAMRGALVDGNGNNVDFETAFEATRGVKYSKEKIELCQQKAETYAQADMFHTGLEDLISNLEKFSYGSTDLKYAKEFNKNALKTLSMLGLSDQGKINEALAETSKAVGYEIKLIKQGTKGKGYYGQDYAIMFKNKDGKFVPLTPEISRTISKDLISKIDATKKALLGLPLDSSDKEVEKYLEQLKNDYEQSFKEAYGDKDISTLSEEYITAQQKGLMAVNLGANIVLIATSMLTGGVTAGLMTGLLMTQPLQALEMFTDENAETNLEAYGKMMLSQIPWMGAGMVMGKLGDLARSFVKLKGLQNLATNSGRSLDDLINIATNASKTGHKLPADLQKAMQITRRIADASGMSVEMALDYAVTKLVQPEGATTQDWIMSFVGALAGSSLNKNISDFTKTKDVRAVELQKAFPDLRLSAEEAEKIISKIDEMVADGSWEKAVAKGADESGIAKASDTSSSVKTAKSIDEFRNELKNSLGAVILDKYGVKLNPEEIERIIANIFRNTDDVNVIQQRYNVLTTKRNYVINYLIDSELSNSDFILDNIDKVSSVFTRENIRLIGPNSEDLLASLSKESLDLLASCTNKNDLVNCVKNIIYDASSHNIELGNRTVTVNLSDVIAIISGKMSLSYFETGSSAKFEQTVRNLTEIENFKEGEQYYYKITEGILLQRPDLIKIVDELNEALANSSERDNIVIARFFEEKMNSGELPETITLQTVKPDENALILPEDTFNVFKTRYLTTTKVADESAEVKVAKENIGVKTSLESTPAVAAKPKYESPKVEIFETVPDKDLCVSEGAPSSNSIGFIDRIKSFFGIEKTAPVSESSTQTIAPRVFAPKKSGKTIIKDYPAYEHFDPDNCKFTSKAKPVVLKRSHPSPNEKVLHISNFADPGGTIAISTTLDQAISTDQMLQCAGIAIVDKSQNLQTLVHCFPGSIDSNKQILEYIFSHSDSKNLEIYIVPGSSYYTDQTINFLLETSKELAGDAKITLCNLPRRNFLAEPSDNTVAFGKEAVVLKNGELTCCEANDLVNKIVNPEGKIICTNTYDNKLAATVVVPKATPTVKQTSEKIATVPQISNLDLSNFEFKQYNYADTNDYIEKYVPIRKELHAKRMEAFGSEGESPSPRLVSKSQFNAMYNIQYEMGEYHNVQAKLKSGQELNTSEQRFFDSVMEAMEPITSERTLWRSIKNFEGLEEQIRSGKISANLFSSTAAEYTDFYDFWTNEHLGYDENGVVITEGCMLKINVPEGTPILDCNAVYNPFIGKKQYTRMRGEVVLPPGEYVIRNYDPELKIFEVDFVPKNNASTPSSPVTTPQVSKPKWTPEKAIKAIENMCPKDDSKDFFLDVEAKCFIEAIPNMDMANMDLYLEVIKTAIDYNINARSSIVNNGYLSSKEGAENFLKLKEMFPYDAQRARDWKRQELDLVVASIKAKNLQSALDRDLFKKYGDDYSKINRVAGYTEKQYAQMTEFEAQGIGYISDNDEINRVLLAYGKNVKLPSLLEKFSNDLIKMFENDEVALKSTVDKLISYDNHKVVLTFNEVQDKKFALDNMDDLILFEQRLTSALDEAKLPSLDTPWVSFYEVKTCYRNDSIKTLLEIFKSGKFSDLEVAKIALKAKTGNTEHLDLISKLTKSDLDSETIVNLIEKICIATYDRTIASMDAWYEAEEYPLKLDLYNTLKELDTKTKQVLESCGYDANAVLKDLSVMFDRTIAVSDVSIENQRNYLQNVLSNNNPTAENVFKNFDFSQFGEQGLPLKYTRADFNSNIENILSTLSNEEQNMLLQHFGLKRGVVGFEGLPSNKPFEAEAPSTVKQAASKIQQEIESFTLKNEVMINNPEAKAVFEALIQGFPEFTSIVGKVQHGTHAYTVDIHTLKVLQDAMNDPYYNRLSDTDKTVVKFAVLMHDFGKRGGIVDTGHATLSTDYASSILERYPFSSELKKRITDTVKLHHWFEAYNKGEATAMDVAINCRNKADYYIMRMFAKADLGNVNPTFHLGRISQGARNQAEFDAFFERQMQPIGDARMQINSKSSPIYTSRFVKNGEKFSRETAVVNGQTHEYRVLNLSQLSAGEDLQKYGFAPGTTKENFAMLSHMTEDNSASLESVIRVMLDPNKDSSWSLSLFNDEYNQFYGDRRCGIIVDTELKNIVDASRENMHSGTKKNTANAVRSFDVALRFNRDPQSKTVFLKSLRKNGIKLNDYEYAEVMDTLLDNKWQSQNNKDIVLSNGRVLKVNDLQQALDDVRANIIGSDQNEVVARNPIPVALMYRAKSIVECPEWFLELADKYNLPIVLK